jgi:FkbM family methyltransferase
MNSACQLRPQKQSPQSIELNGIKIELADDLSSNMKAVLASGKYEQDEFSIVRRTLNQRDRVLEIGTGIGLISTYCAQIIGSDRVFTYEANPELEKIIRRNFAINNVEPSLEMCLLSHSEGHEKFHIAEDFWSSSTRNLGDETLKEVLVRKRLFNQELDRVKPTYLILDIEGGEYDLLLGSNLQHVKKILIELHTYFIGNDKSQEILSHLSACGFKINRNVTYAQSPAFAFKRRLYEYVRHLSEPFKALEKIVRSLEKTQPAYSNDFHGNLYFEKIR